MFAAHGYLGARRAAMLPLLHNNIPSPAGPKRVPPKFKQQLLELLRIFTTLADAHGLEYWMCSGTLLGAIRNGGLIPWDDDVDLCVTRNSMDRLCQEVIGDARNALGVRVLLDDGFMYKFVFAEPPPGPHSLFLDLFVMERALQSASSPSSPSFGFLDRVLLGPFLTPILQYNVTRQREFWPFEFWYPDEVYPLKNFTFESSLQVRGPADPISYLNRVYGSPLWGMLPRGLPSGQSGVAPGQSWQAARFSYQHNDFG